MTANSQTFPLFLIPLLPLVGAALNLLLGRRLGKRFVTVVACGSVGGALLLGLIAVFGSMFPAWTAWRDAGGTGPGPQITHHLYTWIESGTLNVGLSFLLDPLSSIMVVTITFVGLLIHIYSTGYMAHDPRYHTYFGYLNLFTGAMLILVLGDSLPVMFVGWEGVGVCSYLLIGFWYDKEKNANAGRKAFIVNRIGDFAFLLGVFTLFAHTGALDFAGLKAAAPTLVEPAMSFFGGTGPSVALLAGLLLFVGACGKSAQFPLYVWLPDAMAGPTPVSALIHAATMVTAGVYMIARLSFVYVLTPGTMAVVAIVGAITALGAAIIGFAQTDIKKVLAYSTVSQLGFMFVGVGSGAFVAAVFHLFTHAFFKAGLFLGAGSVMHAFGDRTEIMDMGGLKEHAPTTRWTFWVYCMAIAGIIPFAGFFSKDELLLGAFVAGGEGWPPWLGKVLWVTLTVAAAGTAFYMWRLYYLVFHGKCRAEAEVQHHIHESPAVMTIPLAVLAGGAVVLGFLGLPHIGGLPNFMSAWLDSSITPVPGDHHHSAGLVGGLMAVALAVGVVMSLLARALYKDGPERIRPIVAQFAGLHRVVSNKFYVDEFFHLVLVRPFRWLAQVTYNLVDRVVIDLVLVNGSAAVVGFVGRIARWVQNGDVQRYLGVLVLGVAGLFLLTSPAKPSLRVEGTGMGRTFSTVLSGPEASGAYVRWDLNDDGIPDAEGPRTTWTFDEDGSHKVSVTVTFASGEERRTERTVEIGQGAE